MTKEDADCSEKANLASTSPQDEELETELDETSIRFVTTKGRMSRRHSEKKKRKSIDMIEQCDDVERSRGGGEQEVSIYQQFMHAIEQRNMISTVQSTRHTVATQMSTTLIAPRMARTKTKTFLKSNRVDPVRHAHLDEARTSEETSFRTCIHKTIQDESQNPTDKVNDICSLCKQPKAEDSEQLSATSISKDNSRDFIAFKDKKGRYFCEACAPVDCKKIIYKLEIMNLKLRCVNCKSCLHQGVKSVKH